MGCSVWESKLAEVKDRAALEREGYEQDGIARLEESRGQWAARLLQQQEANDRSASAAEASLQAAQDEWQKAGFL